MYTIDNETTMPIVRRRPRYAEVGQSVIEHPRPLPKPNKGWFPRIGNSVATIPIGLIGGDHDQFIDPRTEDVDHEMAELQPRTYAAIYAEVVKPPVDDAQIEARLALLEQNVKPGITLAQVLTGADLLGVGKHYDLAHFLAVNSPEPAGVDTSIVTDRWGYRPV